MKKFERVSLPGLQWRQRKKGLACYWVAPPKSNFIPRTVNLSPYIGNDEMLRIMVDMYNSDLEAQRRPIGINQDHGTVKYLIRRYELDEHSPFHEIGKGSHHVYGVYLKRLFLEIGDTKLDSITAKELVAWFNQWTCNRTKLAAGRMRLAILKALVTYGIACRIEGCSALYEVIKATSHRLPQPKKRSQFVTAEQVVALRQAAHQNGSPSRALTYALVFETLLRLYDVHQHLDWSHIGDDLILRYTPTKTDKTTGISVTFDISKAPMVVQEMGPILTNGKPKSGPIVLNDKNGKRYTENQFRLGFRQDADLAGVAKDFWARDLRASGITEARILGADIDDLGKIAGHSTSTTTSAVYDRAVLAAGNRVAQMRSDARQTTDKRTLMSQGV